MNSDLLTVSEVARILRCDPTTVRRWIVQGSLEAVRLPRVQHEGSVHQAYRIRRSTLDAVLNAPAGVA
jgi:excisionase family DNA binding protein